MGVNPCHPIKSAPVLPNFTETGWCQMPYVEHQNSLRIYELPFCAVSIFIKKKKKKILLCILPGILCYYSSAHVEQMSNRMLQQGRMEERVMNAAFLYVASIIAWTHTLYLCIIMCQNHTYISLSRTVWRKGRNKWLLSGAARRAQKRGTEPCRGILCVVLPTEQYFGLNLPPVENGVEIWAIIVFSSEMYI